MTTRQLNPDDRPEPVAPDGGVESSPNDPSLDEADGRSATSPLRHPRQQVRHKNTQPGKLDDPTQTPPRSQSEDAIDQSIRAMASLTELRPAGRGYPLTRAKYYERLEAAAPESRASGAPPTGLDLMSLWTALRRRWVIALGLAMCASGIAVAVGWQFKAPVHTARTLVYVTANRPMILFDEGRTDLMSSQKSQIATIKSRLVLKSALANPEVAALPSVRAQGAPETWLESKIQADYSIAPEILRITMTGEHPDELVTLRSEEHTSELQ